MISTEAIYIDKKQVISGKGKRRRKWKGDKT
jgi:hypothetical protein